MDNEQIEQLAEAIYDAHIALAIKQGRPSKYIELAGIVDGCQVYESVAYVNLPMADKARFFELATMAMAGWEKRL